MNTTHNHHRPLKPRSARHAPNRLRRGPRFLRIRETVMEETIIIQRRLRQVIRTIARPSAHPQLDDGHEEGFAFALRPKTDESIHA